ncbi:hypothetical protein DIPPA_15434 [Diplonema papillatum]|nr:hypothetical protein DIPPA_15434 [Diplonema papillatum]
MRGTRCRAVRRWYHMRVELGGKAEPWASDETAKAQAGLRAAEAQLAGAGDFSFDKRTLHGWCRALAAHGHGGPAAKGHQLWLDASTRKGVDPPPPGLLQTLQAQALVATGEHDAALEHVQTRFDGESVPFLPETYALLIDILGLTAAPTPHWDELLSTMLEEGVPLLSDQLTSPVLDALLSRLWATSPVLAWLVYGWRLLAGAEPNAQTYQHLLLSLYKQPHYAPVLSFLTADPGLPKNTISLSSVFENLAALNERGAEGFASPIQSLGPQLNLHATSIYAGAIAGGSDSAGFDAGRVSVAAGARLPEARQVLTEGELELAAVVARAAAAHCEREGAGSRRAVESACFNCRAATPAGWVMRVLADAHRREDLPDTYTRARTGHQKLYEHTLTQLDAWGRHADVVGLWLQMDYFVALYAEAYAAEPHGATPAFAHTSRGFLRALHSAGAVGNEKVAEQIVAAFYYSELPLDIAAANAILTALPGHEVGLGIYRERAGKPNMHPNLSTINALLRSCLEWQTRRAERRAGSGEPVRDSSGAPGGASGRGLPGPPEPVKTGRDSSAPPERNGAAGGKGDGGAGSVGSPEPNPSSPQRKPKRKSAASDPPEAGSSEASELPGGSPKPGAAAAESGPGAPEPCESKVLADTIPQDTYRELQRLFPSSVEFPDGVAELYAAPLSADAAGAGPSEHGLCAASFAERGPYRERSFGLGGAGAGLAAEDPLGFVLGQIELLAHVPLDGGAHALVVANHACRDEVQAAVDAAVRMIEAHHRPNYENLGLWRLSLSSSGTQYPDFCKLVNTVLKERGLQDRCL